MAILVPAELNLDGLHPESERRVVTQLLSELGDDWYVVPKVEVLVNGNNAEIDVVLVSPHLGVLLLEVKGGQIALRDGVWYSNEKRLKESPFEQVTAAKHKLVQRLRQSVGDLYGFFMCEVVVLPDMGDVPAEGLGPGVPRDRVWTKYDLMGARHAVARLQKEHAPVSQERLMKLLNGLCPTVQLSEANGRFYGEAVNRIDEATKTYLDSLTSLANNQRFLVIGGAGTGKTYVAERWARSCAERGQRTLLMCYNVPLADDLAHRLRDTKVVVSSYHKYVLELLAPFGLEVPVDAVDDWWDTVPAATLVQHIDSVSDKFDAIILDEGQDFRGQWLDSIELLLSPTGPKKFLMVADPRQALYRQSWTVPDGFPTLELVTNLRSSRSIGEHVAVLGGARPNSAAPVGPSVIRRETSEEQVAMVVAEEIRRLMQQLDVPASQIAVLVRHRRTRDELRQAQMPVPLVAWEKRDEGSVFCETIHRSKGLERLAVILVDLDEKREVITDYIGASRAILHLSVISRKS